MFKYRHNLIGALIRSCRKERGLTQKQLSDKCEMKQSYLSEVERGKRNITFDTASKIFNSMSYSLNFSVTDLLLSNDT